MRKVNLIFMVALQYIIIATISCGNDKTTPEKYNVATPEIISKDSMIKHGQYLVTIMGCNECHSPKKMGPFGPVIDSSRFLSGHPENMPIGAVDPKSISDWVLVNKMTTASVGPWGVSYAGNLTPDSTGIGNWTESQFITAIRKGKYKGLENSRPLLPLMPWRNIAKAKDEDLRAIYAYLMSLPPVKNRVPAAMTLDQLFSKK